MKTGVQVLRIHNSVTLQHDDKKHKGKNGAAEGEPTVGLISGEEN